MSGAAFTVRKLDIAASAGVGAHASATSGGLDPRALKTLRKADANGTADVLELAGQVIVVTNGRSPSKLELSGSRLVVDVQSMGPDKSLPAKRYGPLSGRVALVTGAGPATVTKGGKPVSKQLSAGVGGGRVTVSRSGAFALPVFGPPGARVKVSVGRLATRSLKLTQSGEAVAKLRLTKVARAALKKKGRLKVRVVAVVRPPSGGTRKASASATLVAARR